MEPIWLDFQRGLSSELGYELAHEFILQLYASTGGNVTTAAIRYFHVGHAWAPLIAAWKKWILNASLYEPVIIMRDAKPLAYLAGKPFRQVWLNRQICGIGDELSGDYAGSMDPAVLNYLAQNRLDKPFTFVDSGCWGTLVRQLHERGCRFQPLFFFSHNPRIRGFLNDLGVSDSQGELLNDSLECAFPNLVKRPVRFQETRGRLYPVQTSLDALSRILGREALRGVRHGASAEMQGEEALEKLLALAAKARSGEFTGILPSNSPTWSRGSEFLSAWPQDLSWI